MLYVHQILQKKGSQMWTIAPDATVYQALELMAEKNIGAVPVMENNMLVGIFSERDYARKVVLQGRTSRETLIKDLMTKQIYFVKPNRTLDDCMQLMTAKHIRHLPVLNDGKLVGIISIGDVVKGIISIQANTIRELESYITGTGYGG